MKTRIDEEFFAPRFRVGICAISGADGHQAAVKRSTLENLGASVDLYLCGTPSDFLKVISQGPSAPNYLILEGHGDDAGFQIGCFADFIDTGMLKDEVLPYETFAKHLNLPDTTLISTACKSGSKACHQHISKSNVRSYIAPDGSPEHGSDLLFIHRLFYALLVEKKDQANALFDARNVCEDAKMFSE